MRREFLETLHCPYSGSPLRVTEVVQEDAHGVAYGVVASEVTEFPVIAGILRLPVDELRAPLLRLVRSKRTDQALRAALDVPYYEKGGAAINFMSRVAYKVSQSPMIRVVDALKRRLFRVFTDPELTFVETAERLPSRSWAEWEIFRFSTTTFLPVFPLVHVARSGRPILDFGCGVGQGAFLASRVNPTSQIVCADYSFSALYLAKKYFVPQADLVCLDGDYPLPFASEHFATILSSDALHCIDSKVGLTNEFRRLLAADGVILLPHLHNRLSPVRFGSSLSPQGYSRLLDGMTQRVLSGKKVVEDYLHDGALDLESQVPWETLAQDVESLSIVASRDPSVFRRHQGLWERQIDSVRHPVINPIYQADRQGDEWVLRRRVLSNSAKPNGLNGSCLPESVRVKAPSLSPQGLLGFKTANPAEYAQLAKDLVLIDVPERYLSAQR